MSGSVTQCTAAFQVSLSITNSQSLPKLMSIESVIPSKHFILCCPLLLLPSILPSIRVFSSESTLRTRWPKYWSFNFSLILSKEIPRLISFRMNGLVGSPCSLRDSQESSPTPQFKSINSLVLSFVDHNKLWKILQEMGIPDNLTCLLRNPYVVQEATVRAGHRTTDWFQIGKGVRQGCIL